MVLADLGWSSMQMDNPERGFSYKVEGPLDLRMNPERGRPAAALLAALNEAELAEMLVGNADEPQARVIARALMDAQKQTPITTTTALAGVVGDAVSSRSAHTSKE